MRRPYSNYYETQVDWLGKVPSHWKLKAIKWLTPVQRGASPRPIDDPKYFDENGEYAWVRISDVTAAGMYLEGTEEKLSDLGASLSVKLPVGSLFLSIAGSVGKACISKILCCIHDGFVYFPKWQGDPRFLYYVFACGEPYKGLGKLGTQLNLNTDTVGSIKIAVPESDEQIAISNYLDKKTAAIDRLISKKKQFINLLLEKRRTLILNAVTGRNLTRAESSSESAEGALANYLPNGWKIIRLKHKWMVLDCKHITAEFQDEGFPVASIREVKEWEVNLDEAKFTNEETYRDLIEGGHDPRIGDLLFSRNVSVGDVAQVTEKHPRFAMGQDVCLLRKMEPDVSTDYFQFQLRSTHIGDQLANLMIGSTFKRVNVEQIRNLELFCPPHDVQIDIANLLRKQTSEIDRLLERVNVAVDSLLELRSSLITSVVTGKLDVREMQQ